MFDDDPARTRPAAVLFVLASAVAWPALGASPAEEAPIPGWFLEHVTSMTEGSGRWIVSNAEYRSEAEPFDAYGLEFERGLGGKSLRGRLFALRDGEEVGSIWELHTVWHPGRRGVFAYQFGADGTLGVGEMVRHGERSHRIEQEFFGPDGQEYRLGHENEVSDGRMEAKSFDIEPDGTWKPRRSYTWHREPTGGRTAADASSRAVLSFPSPFRVSQNRSHKGPGVMSRLPGAKVTATSDQTLTRRTAVSDAEVVHAPGRSPARAEPRAGTQDAAATSGAVVSRSRDGDPSHARSTTCPLNWSSETGSTSGSRSTRRVRGQGCRRL